MYTIAAILGEVILPYTKEILEVLNHCRFDKMKPVREAAIEAINLIKDLDPNAEDNQSQDSTSKHQDKTARSTVGSKPWKKKKSQNIGQEDPSSFAAYSNIDQDEENKVSTTYFSFKRKFNVLFYSKGICRRRKYRWQQERD